MGTTPREIFFVGTIPLTRELDVFRMLARTAGKRLPRVPDGELGDRKMWVNSQYPVMAASPQLEVGPFPEGGITRRTTYHIPLRVRAGADTSNITFSDLGYWRHANASYTLFRELKKAGEIPSHWRFQVNLPTPSDVMPMLEPKDRGIVEEHYKRALLGELRQILQAIPHDQLAITWDVVQAVLVWEDPENKYVTPWFEDAKQGYLNRLVELGNEIPLDVELGYHLCYGSQDHKHAIEPRDLSACVALINAIGEKLGRKIDYVHMPVPRDRADDSFYSPLAKLNREKIKKTYLGLVHYTDGVDGAERRIAIAEKFLPDFGIATECGFGRRPSHQEVERLIALHSEILR